MSRCATVAVLSQECVGFQRRETTRQGKLCQLIFLADTRQVQESSMVREECWGVKDCRLASEPAGDKRRSTESSNECCNSGMEVEVL